MENNSGENLLLLGQQAREKGNTLEAVDLFNRAMEAFAENRDYLRFAHALLDRGICWQHLYQFKGNEFCYAVLHKKDAEAMLEIVKEKGLSQEEDGAYFMNAKSHMLFGNYGQAAEFFQLALEKLDPNKQAQKGDWLSNLGKALYLKGEKEKGVEIILQGIEQIKEHSRKVDSYTFNAWLSGGYLRLAEILQKDNPQQSEDYFAKAREIIENDPELAVRKKQLENFFKTGQTGL